MPVKPVDLVMSTVLVVIESRCLYILYTSKYYFSWSVHNCGMCVRTVLRSHDSQLDRNEKTHAGYIMASQSLLPVGHSECFWL